MSSQQIKVEDLSIVGKATQCTLNVRRKWREGDAQVPARRTVVCVHGATYPSTGTFDLGLDGISWMDDLASAGYDVYALDLAGYGRSKDWPPMHATADAHPPLLSTADAAADLGTVVDHVLQNKEGGALCLLGWSWGSTVCAKYTAEHGIGNVARLVLHAPQWIRQSPPPPAATPTVAYRRVAAADAVERWVGAIPETHRQRTAPEPWTTAWVEANFSSSGTGGTQPSLTAPNGVLRDNAEYWGSGKALYNPALIKAPTLLILGEWDRDTPPYMANAVFAELKHAREKRLIVLSGGTHMMMLEQNRAALFAETRLFLDQN